MNRLHRLATLSFLLTPLLVAGCDDDTSSDAPIEDATDDTDSGNAEDIDITLFFDALANGALISEDALVPNIGLEDAGEGIEGGSFQIDDFRFYIHDLTLVDADDNEAPITLEQNAWQYDNVALVDLSNVERGSGNAEVNASVVGTAPAGEWTALRFTLGVPFELNHSDTAVAPSPLNVTAMAWSWQGGRKFLRLDGQSGTGAPVFIHLGSTGCEGEITNITSCQRPNRRAYELPWDGRSTAIGVDIAAIFDEVHLDVNTTDTPSLCMSGPSDPECEPIFTNLGLDLSDGVTPVEGGDDLFSILPVPD